MSEPEKMVLIGTEKMIELWKTIYGNSVDYIVSKPLPTEMTPIEQALESLDVLIDYYFCLNTDEDSSHQQMLLCEKIRKALQAQVEKDRVMELMANAIFAAQAQTPYDGKLNNMAHQAYEEALAEYAKVEGV